MSETTNLKLKKHDNPETNEEQFDIENYLNGNWDKIDENVGEVNTDISNIKKEQEKQNTNIEENNSKIVELQTEKAKLETELKEMQEDFYQNSIRGQASGEYIHVEDSSNCRAKIGIGGNSEQETREGYNLLNFDVKQDSRVTYNKEDGTVTINGQGGFYLKLDRINLTANKTYKQKLEFISGSAKTISGTDMKNQAVMSLKVETWLKNDNYIAYTPEADTTKSGLWLNANVNFDNAKIRIWAYEGTEDKGYEQYGAMPSSYYPSQVVAVGSNGSVKVTKCNKNIWNLGNKGNNSGDIRFPLKSGKYTLSFKKKRISNSTITNEWVYRYAYIRFYDKNDTLLSSIKDGMAINLTANQTSDRQIIDFTAPENTVKMIVNFSNHNGDINNNTEAIEIQLEGEKATSFEQHEEQSYIMPIQQEMLTGDYIKDVEHHGIGKYVFTGEEAVTIAGSRFQVTYYKIAKGKTAQPSLCNISTYASWAETGKHFNVNNSDCYFTIDNFDFLTVEEMKAYLKAQYEAGTPVKIYYPLVTPIDLPLTVEQQAVAKELNNARTYKNVTNITTDSKAILSLDYAKDLETLLNNTQALAVNNASEGV